MKEYHKIKTVFDRDPENKFKTLIDGQFASPEFEYLANNKWEFTEKVDGTNIRIEWDGEKVTFKGRTDRAQLYAPLIEKLQEYFYSGAMSQCFTSDNVCLYGEGFGAKIQKAGENYLNESVDFTLFDVLVGDTWLNRDAVEGIANTLQISIVPIIGEGTLYDAIELCRTGFNSTWGNFAAEGIVARPTIEMVDRRGRRIITKIKCKDF
jgi:hypothetical protein